MCDVIVLSSTTMSRVAHQTVAILHVPGKPRQRMHHPEFGQRQLDAPARPVRGQPLQVQRQRPAFEHVLGRLRREEQVAAAEQCRDARGEMRQADVLRQIIVGAEAQAGHRVEIAVARGEEEYRHRRRQRTQFATKREAAVDVVGQPDVDDREVGKARAKRGERVAPIRVGGDLVTLFAQDVRVVVANRGFVLDDGYAAAHGFPAATIAQPRRR